MPFFKREASPSTHRLTPKAARQLSEARPKRVLVLGSEGHARGVTAYSWDRAPAGINPADFDVVVLNFAAFEDDQALARGMPLDRLPSQAALTQLVFSEGAELIAIGDPRTQIGDPRLGYRHADYWLPGSLSISDNSGTQYKVLDDSWQGYFSGLSSWSWIFDGYARGQIEPSDYLAPVTRAANEVEIAFEAIAETRFDKPIGFKAHMRAVEVYRHNPPGLPVATDRGIARGKDVVLEASPVFWLPRPNTISVGEAIDLLLRDRFGIAAERRVPGWATGFSLPNEAPIAQELEELLAERERLDARLEEARDRARLAARPKIILYEKGKEVLEPAVREVLRELGARVDDPDAEGVEDGTLFLGGAAGKIEIKGRAGQLKLDDVRQVVQWSADAKGRDGIEYKPLIFGNPHCELPPHDRGEPWAPNAKRYAENSGVGLVTTPQLYEALRSKQEGSFDENSFWGATFTAEGMADLPEPVRAS